VILQAQISPEPDQRILVIQINSRQIDRSAGPGGASGNCEEAALRLQ
jgi:hypothetical protein